MPQETTQQPLRPDQPRDPRDERLVGQVLGPEAEAEMEELVGGNTSAATEESSELQMTETEEAAAKKAEVEVNPEKRRQEYYEWGREINLGKNWIDVSFIFNDDGTVTSISHLVLDRIITPEQMPPALVEVRGFLDLNGLTLAEGLVLPKIIGRALMLDKLTTTEGLVFPESIGGHLYLKNLTSGFIPAGCKVNGEVVLDKRQTIIIQDARDKGYNVRAE